MIIFLIPFLISCTPEKKPDCTWYCADPNKIPESCACLEDIVGRDVIEKEKKKDKKK